METSTWAWRINPCLMGRISCDCSLLTGVTQNITFLFNFWAESNFVLGCWIWSFILVNAWQKCLTFQTVLANLFHKMKLFSNLYFYDVMATLTDTPLPFMDATVPLVISSKIKHKSFNCLPLKACLLCVCVFQFRLEVSHEISLSNVSFTRLPLSLLLKPCKSQSICKVVA